jgi:predicted porin
MKKSLFALAAVTAFAGAAQAQSSVTVYGILDVGYTGANARASSNTTGVLKETTSRIGNSMESGSRIGFRGNEDLGGGTAAIFTFEVGIQPAGNAGNNSTGASADAAGAGTWSPNVRQAFVGLTQKGMGNVRVGTQNTLFWEQAGSNTTGQLAQTLGSMLAPSTDGAFLSSSAQGGNAGSQSAAYTARTTNTIRFASDRMMGLIAKAAYTQSNRDSTQTANTATSQTGGNNNQSGYQLALDYVFKKANVQASYASFTSENPYTVAPSAATTIAWGSGIQGNNSKDAQTLITASYDFGILKAYAGWTNRKVSSSFDSNFYLKRTAQEIGVRSFITPKIEGWASAGNGRFSAFGNAAPTANIVGYQLGSNYWMSKRTNLYAIFGTNGTSSTTNGAYNVNQYSIGARHTF